MSDTWKYFKTALPGNRLIIQSTGKGVPVTEIDYSLGVVMVKNDVVVTAIEDQIRHGRGGWSTMTNEEYDAAIQKKSTNSQVKPWREELGGRNLKILPQTYGQPKKASVAVDGNVSAPVPAQAQRTLADIKPDAAPTILRPTSTKRPN